jgi:hypothetical protein
MGRVDERERGGGPGWIRMKPEINVPPVERKRKGARKKRNRGEREKRLPKGLCANL